jgi:hypothetical protein
VRTARGRPSPSSPHHRRPSKGPVVPVRGAAPVALPPLPARRLSSSGAGARAGAAVSPGPSPGAVARARSADRLRGGSSSRVRLVGRVQVVWRCATRPLEFMEEVPRGQVRFGNCTECFVGGLVGCLGQCVCVCACTCVCSVCVLPVCMWWLTWCVWWGRGFTAIAHTRPRLPCALGCTVPAVWGCCGPPCGANADDRVSNPGVSAIALLLRCVARPP